MEESPLNNGMYRGKEVLMIDYNAVMMEYWAIYTLALGSVIALGLYIVFERDN